MGEATQFDYLMWFWLNADFGPADEDVRLIMEDEFEEETRQKVPATLSYKETN